MPGLETGLGTFGSCVEVLCVARYGSQIQSMDVCGIRI